MILTVTLNTALDITYRVRSLRPHASHRVSEVTERPGGKGVNVARVLAALGYEVTVTGFTGGATGRVVQEKLAAVPGVVDALVPVSGATRRTVAVVDDRSGDTTQLNEPGPTITPSEWSAFLAAYDDLLPAASAVALCGSCRRASRWARTRAWSARPAPSRSRSSWTPAAKPCAVASRPAPTSSSRTPTNWRN